MSDPGEMIPAVDEDTFWSIIDAARASAKPFRQALVDHLATRAEQEILDYDERFLDVSGALNRWDVWAAAYLMGRGCSDDSFMDFRAGVVAQGRDWYSRVVTSPDSLADHPAVPDTIGRPWDNPLFCEQVNCAASYAFRRVTGDNEAFYEAVEARDAGDREPLDPDEQFDFNDEDEMRRRLPRLSALCMRAGQAVP
jgi:hypothetical protein